MRLWSQNRSDMRRKGTTKRNKNKGMDAHPFFFQENESGREKERKRQWWNKKKKKKKKWRTVGGQSKKRYFGLWYWRTSVTSRDKIVRVQYFVRGGFVGHRSRVSSKHLSLIFRSTGFDSSGIKKGLRCSCKMHVWVSGPTKTPTAVGVPSKESPIPRIRKKGSLSIIPHRVWVSSLAPNPPCSCSFAISLVPKSALIRGFSIAFLSLIGTQTVPRSPQFGIHRTERTQYRFFLLAGGTSNGSLKIQSPFGCSRSPYIFLSNHLSPYHSSVISCSSATPVGLSPFDLLLNGC
ncbi:hypothetical protein TNCV_1664911 [Trichonephila clavipes]|uniref:Uncharacterized protein n=1 Tax=Trichonephila clavipes TaxID=2585209 RepID=A0A8X6RRI7_TRICX|nr:hypothetical protein TNCV_1664911 [Trichonephila clavipes]